MILAVESLEAEYLEVADRAEELGVPSQITVQIVAAMKGLRPPGAKSQSMSATDSTAASAASPGSTAPFVHGAIFKKKIETTKGPVHMLAEVSISGRTLTLRDIAIFSRGHPISGLFRGCYAPKPTSSKQREPQASRSLLWKACALHPRARLRIPASS